MSAQPRQRPGQPGGGAHQPRGIAQFHHPCVCPILAARHRRAVEAGIQRLGAARQLFLQQFFLCRLVHGGILRAAPAPRHEDSDPRKIAPRPGYGGRNRASGVWIGCGCWPDQADAVHFRHRLKGPVRLHPTEWPRHPGGGHDVGGVVPVRKAVAALAVLPPQERHQSRFAEPAVGGGFRSDRLAGIFVIKPRCHGPRMRANQAKAANGLSSDRANWDWHVRSDSSSIRACISSSVFRAR
jgi:hypothetical protein